MTSKNLTVTLSEDDSNDLDSLVEYFQSKSISKVTKTDVVRYMIKETKKDIESKKTKTVI